MQKIKNIVFDLGNVLVDLDFAKSQGAFATLLGQNLEMDTYNMETASLFKKFELGKVSSEEFLNQLRIATQQPVEDTHLVAAWNAMLLGIKAARFPMLRKLKTRYRLFVLSNTNEIHREWIFKHVATVHGITDFQTNYFEKIYCSDQLGLRKPERAIYDFVLQDAQLVAGETLLIDDKVENIDMAMIAGWQGRLHDPEMEIAELLKDF
ncbi:MAG: HAD family hydrolase [Saprospiraceae bacterium]